MKLTLIEGIQKLNEFKEPSKIGQVFKNAANREKEFITLLSSIEKSIERAGYVFESDKKSFSIKANSNYLARVNLKLNSLKDNVVTFDLIIRDATEKSILSQSVDLTIDGTENLSQIKTISDLIKGTVDRILQNYKFETLENGKATNESILDEAGIFQALSAKIEKALRDKEEKKDEKETEKNIEQDFNNITSFLDNISSSESSNSNIKSVVNKNWQEGQAEIIYSGKNTANLICQITLGKRNENIIPTNMKTFDADKAVNKGIFDLLLNISRVLNIQFDIDFNNDSIRKIAQASNGILSDDQASLSIKEVDKKLFYSLPADVRNALSEALILSEAEDDTDSEEGSEEDAATETTENINELDPKKFNKALSLIKSTEDLITLLKYYFYKNEKTKNIADKIAEYIDKNPSSVTKLISGGHSNGFEKNPALLTFIELITKTAEHYVSPSFLNFVNEQKERQDYILVKADDDSPVFNLGFQNLVIEPDFKDNYRHILDFIDKDFAVPTNEKELERLKNSGIDVDKLETKKGRISLLKENDTTYKSLKDMLYVIETADPSFYDIRRKRINDAEAEANFDKYQKEIEEGNLDHLGSYLKVLLKDADLKKEFAEKFKELIHSMV